MAEIPSEGDSASDSIRGEFRAMRQLLDEEQIVRTAIHSAVKTGQDQANEAIAILQGVHQSTTNLSQLLCDARSRLPTIQASLKQLSAAFPADQYHRYHDNWRTMCRNLAFLGAFIHYLETGGLISRSDLAALFTIGVCANDGFHITLEDMLLGVLQLAKELSRLAVNAVIHGDVQRPISIAAYLNELNSAFQLLNLKNDQLRRRYDGLKYDVKKVEEVMYDLAIRGLTPTADK